MLTELDPIDLFGPVVFWPPQPEENDGSGGLPLFLIGFALISFPGKRRLTARVLRGRPVQFRPALFALICAGTALIAPALVLLVVRHRPWWFAQARAGAVARGPIAVAALCLILGAVVWVLVRLTPHVLNVLLRTTARARRKFRPWFPTSPHPPAAATVATPPSSRAGPRSVPAER